MVNQIAARTHAPLKRSLMLAFATFTLATTSLFALFAMALVYSVEDRFFNAMLRDEAKLLSEQFALTGRWARPQRSVVSIHEHRDSMPEEVRRALDESPEQREFSGVDGRHYHLLPFSVRSEVSVPPRKVDAWLLAEVSGELVVRPRRNDILRWLFAWGLAAVVVAAALAAWLARRVSAPIEKLASRVASTSPESPQPIATSIRGGSRELVVLAHAFDALAERTSAFVNRERRFTREASHELRTPLAVLGMSIERLQSDPATDERVGRELSSMRASVHAMEQSVASLLLLAREDESTMLPSETALLPLLESWIVANERWLTLKNATLSLKIDADARLPMPAGTVHVLIANLIGNALQHGSSGTPVEVTASADSFAVVNSVDRDVSLQLESNAPRPPDRGFGLSIVRRALERYGFMLEISQNDQRVRAEVKRVVATRSSS